jgi:hypothetical protein
MSGTIGTGLVILLCGYKGTGKDTFAYSVGSGNYQYTYNLYCCEDYSFDEASKIFIALIRNCNTIAFADKLKCIIHQTFEPIGVSFDALDKDEPAICINNVEYSMRDLCKAFAPAIRQYIGDDTFAKIDLDPYRNYIITDWRFKVEYDTLLSKSNCAFMTARIFDPKKIPSADDKSEHELDEEWTEFLITDASVDFNDVLKYMPQYKDHKLFMHMK